MYNPPDIAMRIKSTAKEKGVLLKTMLEEVGLGPNTISHMHHGMMPSVDTIARIADSLGCSVDYLLGRNNTPVVYSAEVLSDRIKALARKRGVMLKDVLSACDLNINSLSQMSDKKGLSSFSLAKIADYLDCSVDYLLGRSDNPMVNR